MVLSHVPDWLLPYKACKCLTKAVQRVSKQGFTPVQVAGTLLESGPRWQISAVSGLMFDRVLRHVGAIPEPNFATQRKIFSRGVHQHQIRLRLMTGWQTARVGSLTLKPATFTTT